MNDPDRLVMVGGSPGAEHHGSQAERADFYTGTTEGTKVHGWMVAANTTTMTADSADGGQVLADQPLVESRADQVGPRPGRSPPLLIALPAGREANGNHRHPLSETGNGFSSHVDHVGRLRTGDLDGGFGEWSGSHLDQHLSDRASRDRLDPHLGHQGYGPGCTRLNAWAGNSWNWVARTMVAGSGPSRAAASWASFAW